MKKLWGILSSTLLVMSMSIATPAIASTTKASTWTLMKGSTPGGGSMAYANGTLYALGDGVAMYRNGRWIQMQGLQHSLVFSLLYANGALYAGTNSGVWTPSHGAWTMKGLKLVVDGVAVDGVYSIINVNGTMYAMDDDKGVSVYSK